MEYLLNSSVNKLQAIIKLEIAKDNLVGVSQALSEHDQPRLKKAMNMIQEVLEELVREREAGNKI